MDCSVIYGNESKIYLATSDMAPSLTGESAPYIIMVVADVPLVRLRDMHLSKGRYHHTTQPTGLRSDARVEKCLRLRISPAK